jgi:hypothetical protein
MTLELQLQLPLEYIDALRKHAAANGENIDAYVSQLVVDSLQAEMEATRLTNTSQQSFGDWLQAWAERHPKLDHEIDDSRESIYAG